MKEDNKTYIIIICIMGAIILGLLGYIVLNNSILKEHKEITNKAEDIINDVQDKIEDGFENKDNMNDDSYKIDDFYGEYKWQKQYTGGVNNAELTYKIELKLNSDGTASYSASDGMASDSTTGSFKLEDNKIIYTKKYYNYNNGNTTNKKEVTEDDKIVTFDIIDKNTLKINYYNQIAELKK